MVTSVLNKLDDVIVNIPDILSIKIWVELGLAGTVTPSSFD